MLVKENLEYTRSFSITDTIAFGDSEIRPPSYKYDQSSLGEKKVHLRLDKRWDLANCSLFILAVSTASFIQDLFPIESN